jgi:2-hydroxycyclohexanecarboxyl-CoA dehydrogenase
MDFTDEIAVVTGAASGIGRAIAVALAGNGAAVVAADRDLPGAEQTAAAHDGITAVFLDLTSSSSIGAARDEVARRFGPASILVNAAGWDVPGPFLETSEQFWLDVVDINYVGHLRVCHAFLPSMIASGRGGSVVNVASDAGRVGSAGETVYAGAKGGVIAFTKSLARELARYQITVNCVCPGPTDTPLFQSLPESMREALIRAIPFRRVAQPAEIADAVLFFASGLARYITGQVLSVSGGLTMAG